jgi:methylated-DNA-[protein]-cysteine S-methyltransferase
MRVTRHPYAVEGWGVGELWVADGCVVVAHDPPSASASEIGSLRPPRGTRNVSTNRSPTDTLSREPSRDGHGFVEDVLQRLHGYFAGRPTFFADVRLDLDGTTCFHRDAAEVLRNVPWGEVVTYGELAELAGYPRAARAAGTFCAHNRFSLFLPCHRVVGAGGIGGYGSLGVEYKRKLLRLEGHASL